MPWTFDDTHAIINNIPHAVGSTYFAFRRTVRDQNLHPRDAARQLRITHYENLGKYYYSIRLPLGHYIYFLVSDATRTVLVLQVGGHR